MITMCRCDERRVPRETQFTLVIYLESAAKLFDRNRLPESSDIFGINIHLLIARISFIRFSLINSNDTNELDLILSFSFSLFLPFRMNFYALLYWILYCTTSNGLLPETSSNVTFVSKNIRLTGHNFFAESENFFLVIPTNFQIALLNVTTTFVEIGSEAMWH